MHTLRFSGQSTPPTRPNSFTMQPFLGMYRMRATVRATDQSPSYPVECWVQIANGTVPRGHDDEGHPVLLASRTGDTDYTLEACRLHANLPLSAYLLLGWSN